MDEHGGAPTSTGDRSRFAALAAGCGLGIGSSLLLAYAIGGQGGAVAGVVVWLALLAAVWWLEKKTPTVPEQFRRWTRIGFGTSLVVYLAAARPWLVSQDDVAWWMLLVGGFGVALPSLIAAGMIARHRD